MLEVTWADPFVGEQLKAELATAGLVSQVVFWPPDQIRFPGLEESDADAVLAVLEAHVPADVEPEPTVDDRLADIEAVLADLEARIEALET